MEDLNRVKEQRPIALPLPFVKSPNKFVQWLNALRDWWTTPLKSPNWLKPTPQVFLGLFVVCGGLSYLVVAIPQWQTTSLSQESLTQKIAAYKATPNLEAKDVATIEKGRIDTENAIRTGLVQGLGGAAVLIGIYFAYRNLKVAEDKQVTERFSKAVEMFSNSNLHTRLGGLYALERIANDSDKDYPQVMEILCAFVRTESPYPPKDIASEGATSKEKIPDLVEPSNLQERTVKPLVAVVKNKATQSTDSQDELPEWLKEVLREEMKEQLQRENEEEKFFAALPPLRTDIQAVMTVIGRRKHRFLEGETKPLSLQKTDLRRLDAYKANLTGINFFKSCLEGANLSFTDMEGAYLEDTELSFANLEYAYLQEANLTFANLTRATLVQADLETAFLLYANLQGANLRGANLSQVDSLTQEQLNEAFINDYTKLPPFAPSFFKPYSVQLEPDSPTTPSATTPVPISTENAESSSESRLDSKGTET